MDLVFNALPDVFSYQSLRHATYDAPWLNDSASDKGKRPHHQQQQQPRRRPLQPQQQQPQATVSASPPRRSSASCDSCPLCLEKQRRPLATYIRSKSRQDKREDASIREEEEEEEEEEAEMTAPAAEGTTPAAGAPAHA